MEKSESFELQGEDVNVSIGNMERVVSFWGLRFTDKNNQILTNIDSVYISNVKGTDVFNLGTGKFEELNPSDESQNIVITPPAGKKISSAGGKYTYVAMFPGTYKDVIVMAYVGNTCYMREYASLTFTLRYRVSNGLRVTLSTMVLRMVAIGELLLHSGGSRAVR